MTKLQRVLLIYAAVITAVNVIAFVLVTGTSWDMQGNLHWGRWIPADEAPSP